MKAGTIGLCRAAAAALLLAGCQAPGTAPPRPDTGRAPTAHVHAATGMAFPDAVGDFVRSGFTRYDMAGLDVGAGYELTALPGGALAAAVSIHPLPATACEAAFEAGKREVAADHPGAKVTEETAARLVKGGAAHAGRKAAFTYNDLHAGRRQPLRSELYVFCPVGERWVIQYRFTAPAGFAAGEPIAEFLARMPWPESVL
ncbi:MAG: hypothetical protein IH626_22595 [Rhodospirillales bacterium]|nr:hypothetical protein [Rhodospirillales bacterium]